MKKIELMKILSNNNKSKPKTKTKTKSKSFNYNINNYELVEDYFNLYLKNNQKLVNIISDNVNTYNFKYNFKSSFRKSNTIITRTLSEHYNLIFTLNAIIEKKIIGYCIKTGKKYICEKWSYEKHNTFLYFKTAYHFNCKEDEFIIYFSWEYFSPIAIKYTKDNKLINISYRYNNEEIKNSSLILIPNKNTKTIISKNNKLVYVIGIISNAGHYFWNEIMGILLIIQHNLLNNIDLFIIGINDYLNFKDILKNKFNIPDFKIKILRDNNIMNENDILINTAKNHINNKLIILLKELYNFNNITRKDKHINILFDIRTNDRICLNQYELIKNILINIPNKYKDNIFNFSVSGWFSHNNDTNNNINIIKQKEIINELKQNFTINDLIGLKLEELIKNVENIDIIISNSGSGVSFFSSIIYNPYSISFTNINSYDAFKEQDNYLNVQKNIYIDKNFIISDINNNLNFTVDINAITNLVENIIDKII